MKQLFLGSFLVYLLIVPLLSKRIEIFRDLLHNLHVPVPPVWLGTIFILNYVIYRLFRGMRPWDLQWGLTEVQEFNFSLILLILPLVWLGVRSSQSYLKSE